MFSSKCFFVVLTVFVLLSFVASENTGLVNWKVERYIDISTQLVNVKTDITVINNETDSIQIYLFCVDPHWVENLSYIAAVDKDKHPLVIKAHGHPTTGCSSKAEYNVETKFEYEILFTDPLAFGESTHLSVYLIITNYLKSYPKSVKQGEKHMVLFSYNMHYYSVYFSNVHTTYLYMGTTKEALIDGAKYELENDSEYGLQLGPSYNEEPYTSVQSVFHYENTAPFLIAEKVTRFIKISHWGFISVWDQIQILHSGPKFIGPFKRGRDKEQNSASGDTVVEMFYSTLPEYAFDVYLKDGIGLIWSSIIDYYDPRGVVVRVVPRYVLYGGWRVDYEIGYSLPISGYVTRHANNEFKLSIPLTDKIFDNMIIKEAEINVILPEGAKLIDLDPNFDLENKTDSKYCYYFDTTCRDVITFKRYNLVEKHITNISVSYEYLQMNLLVKPVTIAIALYLILALIKVCVTVDLSIQKEDKPARETRPVRFPSHESSSVSSLPVVKKKNKKISKQK